MKDLAITAIWRRAQIAILVLTLAACVPMGDLAPRHAPSGRDVPMPSADFAAYAAAAEVAIAEANEAAAQPLEAAVVRDRAPFELPPQRGSCPRAADGRNAQAALLIHDLGGTPYEMRDLGRAFAGACYLVRSILLPGHGTVPGDLLDVDYQQWVEATRRAVASFEGVAGRLVLVGFGLGGTLALHYALGDEPLGDLELGGLVLLAPALGPAPLAWLDAPGSYAQLTPKARWARLLPDDDPMRYQSLPRNAEAQQTSLVEAVAGSDRVVDVPVFMAVSAVDVEVDPDAARAWFCRRLSGPRRLLWYTAAPARSTDCRFVSERSSADTPGVIDYAHVALPIAPDNPRYGAGAAYHDCAHYYWEEDTPNWLICVDVTKTPDNSELRYGEISEANLRGHVIRRLTYNPDFDAMVRIALAVLADAGE